MGVFDYFKSILGEVVGNIGRRQIGYDPRFPGGDPRNAAKTPPFVPEQGGATPPSDYILSAHREGGMYSDRKQDARGANILEDELNQYIQRGLVRPVPPPSSDTPVVRDMAFKYGRDDVNPPTAVTLPERFPQSPSEQPQVELLSDTTPRPRIVEAPKPPAPQGQAVTQAAAPNASADAAAPVQSKAPPPSNLPYIISGGRVFDAQTNELTDLLPAGAERLNQEAAAAQQQAAAQANEQLVGSLLRRGVPDQQALQTLQGMSGGTAGQPSMVTPVSPSAIPTNVPAAGEAVLTNAPNLVQPGAPGQATQQLRTPEEAARLQQMQRMAQLPSRVNPQAIQVERPKLATEVQPVPMSRIRANLATVEPPKNLALTMNGAKVGTVMRDGKPVLVNQYGFEVGNLEDMERGVYKGKRAAVVGNDVVDMEGNKLGTLVDALKDRDFAYEYRIKDIETKMAEAAAAGDDAAMADLEVARARAVEAWHAARPKDTTRSWKEMLGAGIAGALQGYAQSGAGGALGGFATGFGAAAVNPEFGQRLMDQVFRMPKARKGVDEAVARQEAFREAAKGNLEVLGKDAEVRGKILENRKRTMDASPRFQKFLKGLPLSAEDIVIMERDELGFSTGIQPDIPISSQFEWANGVYYAIAPDGTYRMVVDKGGNPLFKLNETVVKVMSPDGKSTFFVKSEDEAKRYGDWALQQWKAGVASARQQASIEARGQGGGATGNMTPQQVRATEDAIAADERRIALIDEELAATQTNIDKLTQDNDNIAKGLKRDGTYRYPKGRNPNTLPADQRKEYKANESALRKAAADKRRLTTEKQGLQGNIERLRSRTTAPQQSQNQQGQGYTPGQVDSYLRP